MEQRQIGVNGPSVGAVGLGCMSFAGAYGLATEEQSFATLQRAIDLGVTHLDTAIVYGMGVSERFIGEFIKDKPGKFHIATKCGIVLKPERGFNNKRDYIREAVTGSLERLGVDKIDLLYLHRRDQEVEIETAMESMAELVAEGTISAIGLSEIAPSTLERASKVHHVAAVQSEYSLWTRLPELGLVQACKRLGTTLVAFSPVGRGAFSEKALDLAALSDTDFRRGNPRFQPDNYARNQAKIDGLRTWSRERGWTLPALSVAWTLAKGDHIISIPGTRSPEHLSELAQADTIKLTAADLAEIDEILPPGFAHGARYSRAQDLGPEPYC